MQYNSQFDNPKFPHEVQKNDWPWKPVPLPYPLSFPTDGWPRISIITPSFNQGQFIEETIRSVLLQGYPNLEYIIMDAGSVDNTIEIIRKYEPWIAYWVSEPDQGQSHAINKGFAKATGDILAWINADDIYLPDALFHVANAFQQNKAEWVVGTTLVTDMNLKVLDRFVPQLNMGSWQAEDHKSKDWLDFVCTKRSGIALPQPSSFWRRNAVIVAGGIDESLRYAMDHELYGRLAYRGFRPILIDESLAYFRTHGEQKTADFPVKFWKEELGIVRNWEKSLTGMEKRSMNEYGSWLNRLIKYYPLKLLQEKVRSQYRYARNSLLGEHKVQ